MTAVCLVLGSGRGRRREVQHSREEQGSDESLAPWKEAWKLAVVTQDRGCELVLPGWLPGCCFPAAS